MLLGGVDNRVVFEGWESASAVVLGFSFGFAEFWKGTSKVNGSGQECPLHTGIGENVFDAFAGSVGWVGALRLRRCFALRSGYFAQGDICVDAHARVRVGF